MLSKLTKPVVVVMLTLTLGLHWACLQSVAWVGMFVSFSTSSTLPVALVKTFDGKHPCNLCKLVSNAKKAEKQQETPKLLIKLDLLLEKHSIWLRPPHLSPLEIVDPLTPVTLSFAPPVPPPRVSRG